MIEISKLIDHTNLKQDAIKSEITQLCEQAITFGFASVCINPIHVELASSILKDEIPKTCTVIGFPLGADSVEMKFAETRFLVHQGAEELDMVMNMGAFKEEEFELIYEEIGQVIDASDGRCVKVIIETCLLTKEEKILASNMVKNSGADFIKTSTGYSIGGATIDDVRLIRETVGREMGVKASGGIKTLVDVKQMIDAGADRVGTSSAVEIVS